jgi:hypothetical protein
MGFKYRLLVVVPDASSAVPDPDKDKIKIDDSNDQEAEPVEASEAAAAAAAAAAEIKKQKEQGGTGASAGSRKSHRPGSSKGNKDTEGKSSRASSRGRSRPSSSSSGSSDSSGRNKSPPKSRDSKRPASKKGKSRRNLKGGGAGARSDSESSFGGLGGGGTDAEAESDLERSGTDAAGNETEGKERGSATVGVGESTMDKEETAHLLAVQEGIDELFGDGHPEDSIVHPSAVLHEQEAAVQAQASSSRTLVMGGSDELNQGMHGAQDSLDEQSKSGTLTHSAAGGRNSSPSSPSKQGKETQTQKRHVDAAAQQALAEAPEGTLVEGWISSGAHLERIVGKGAMDLLEPGKTTEMLLFVCRFRLEVSISQYLSLFLFFFEFCVLSVVLSVVLSSFPLHIY